MTDELVWYVSYGSNMCRERLLCYLRGGRPPGAHRDYTGARDHTPPQEDAAVTLPGTVYFAGRSRVWGGGVAFYDPDRPSPTGGTPARAYLVTAAQFVDIAAQEMHREPVDADPLQQLALAGLPAGRYAAGPGPYETMLRVGERGGRPMLTFSAPYGSGDVPHTPASPAYLAMLATGLGESHHLDAAQIEQYLDTIGSPGAADGRTARAPTARASISAQTGTPSRDGASTPSRDRSPAG